MIFDIDAFLRDAREKERKDRWQLAFTGICPHCDNKRYNRTDDYLTGEIEIHPCHFCHSEAQIEAMNED